MSESPSASSLRAALDLGLDRLGLSASDAQRDKLLDHLGMMSRWGQVYNLSAIRAPSEMMSLHLLDCLAALPPLDAWVSGRGAGAPGSAGVGAAPLRMLDVGSGAGLPGVVLAIMRPQWRVTCVDTVGKKAGFIRQVAAELALPNVQALHARVEAMAASAGGFDLITSRAFSSLADWVRLTRHLLAPGGVWVGLKGRVPDDEIRALPETVTMFHVEPLAVPGLDAARCLVWIKQGGNACTDRSSQS